MGGIALVALLALVWPSVARSSSRLDVAVVGNGAVTESSDEIARHVRERGLSVEVTAIDDPCAPGALADAARGARTVIVSFTATSFGRCVAPLRAAIGALGEHIVVTQDEALVDGAVDARRLVPAGSGVRSGCQWWEPPLPAGAIANCDADGQVAVRLSDATLTVAGRDRFARVVAGALP